MSESSLSSSIELADELRKLLDDPNFDIRPTPDELLEDGQSGAASIQTSQEGSPLVTVVRTETGDHEFFVDRWNRSPRRQGLTIQGVRMPPDKKLVYMRDWLLSLFKDKKKR